ncbi:MAG: hypothetical protein K6T37_03570 [Acidothermus cellulolyticus]|nr:hypothetical protein [Acidothermus cellulolyticus]
MPTTAVRQLSTRLARLDDATLVGLIDNVLASRPSLRAVRDEVVTYLRLGGGADSVTDATVRLLLEAAQPSPRTLTAQLRREAEARAWLLRGDLLEARDVADLLGSTGRNRRQTASALRKAGKLLGLEDRGRVYYPAFQIDATRGQVRPIVAELNQQLGAAVDPWGVASWWLTPHARLPRGKRPADLAVSSRPRDEQTLRDLARSVAEE